MVAALFRDLRYAVRSLVASRGFALAAVASLALGIGANSAIFSLVDALLLRPLPVARPGELVEVYTSADDSYPNSSTSYPDFVDLRGQTAGVFSGLVGYSAMFAPLNDPAGGSRLLMGEVVTGDYFDVLGVKARLGRTFAPEEGAPGAAPVVVISDGFWRRQLAADPGAVGRTVRLRGLDYTVVGVAPAGFSGMIPGFSPELWITAAMVEEVEPVGWQDVVPSPSGATRLEQRGRRWMFVKGRLAPGVGRAAAQAAVDVVMARLAAAYPQTNEGRKGRVVPGGEVRIHPMIDQALAPAAALLMGVVGLVLLVACANVANMLLARATGRRREIGVRLALGAGRGRLVRQLLVESALLAVAGGLVGLVLAYWAGEVLAALPLPLPAQLSLDLGLDLRVFAFTFLLSLATGLLFGLAPALAATRPDLVAQLKDDGAAAGTGRLRRFGLRGLLVVGQVAVTLVLLVGAALLLRSLLASLGADVGFRPQGLALASFDLGMVRYPEAEGKRFVADALERARALPGVAAAAVAERLPFSLNVHVNQVYPEGYTPAPGEPGFALDVTRVSPGFFATLGVPLLRGRDFGPADAEGTPGVVIVNEALARRFWPGEDPIGKRLRTQGPDGPAFEVVGLVADYAVRAVGEEPRPMVHFARDQRYSPYATLVVRGRPGAPPQVEALRRLLLGMEPDLVLIEARTMEQMIGVTLLPARAGAAVVGGFGLLALALAAVGLYGVIAYAVSRRTREIGIRMALGAAPAAVLRQVLGQGAALVAAGLALGAAGALAVTRLLAGAFFGLAPFEPGALLAAAGLLAAVALAANLLPARRAARLDPVTALRRG
jgi:putative ABC transport system permease protein